MDKKQFDQVTPMLEKHDPKKKGRKAKNANHDSTSEVEEAKEDLEPSSKRARQH